MPLSEEPARWLARNEAGWGLPHGLVGMLAVLAAGYATVGIGRWIRAGLRSRRG